MQKANGTPLRHGQRVLQAAAVAVALSFAPIFIGAAAARPVKCDLTIDNRNHADGVCDFDPLGTDGSFILRAKSGIFAYVTVSEPGVADASWNETPSSTHAHSPLGELRRKGACWTNARAKICSWALDSAPAAAPAPAAANAHSQPGALVLSGYPAALTCMVPQRPQKGARLVIGKGDECAGPNAKFVLGEDNIVQLAQDRTLCIASEDRANGPGFLGECASASLLVYNTEEHWVGAVAGESLCLGLKGRPPADGVQPGQAFVSETCAKAADQTIVFQPAAAPQPASAPQPAAAPRASGGDDRTFATVGKWTVAQIARHGAFEACDADLPLAGGGVASLSLNARDEWVVSAPASLPDGATDAELSPKGTNNTHRDRASIRAGRIAFKDVGEAIADAILSGGGFVWRSGAAKGDVSFGGGAQVLERIHECAGNGRRAG